MNSELYEYLAMQFYHDNKDHRHYNYLSHGLKEEVDDGFILPFLLKKSSKLKTSSIIVIIILCSSKILLYFY